MSVLKEFLKQLNIWLSYGGVDCLKRPVRRGHCPAERWRARLRPDRWRAGTVVTASLRLIFLTNIGSVIGQYQTRNQPTVTRRLMSSVTERWVKVKFHYASWFGATSKLVRSWFEPDSVMEFGFEQVFYRDVSLLTWRIRMCVQSVILSGFPCSHCK